MKECKKKGKRISAQKSLTFELLFQCLVSLSHHQSYLKDLKPSDVQDADEGSSLSLSTVQCSVDAVY